MSSKKSKFVDEGAEVSDDERATFDDEDSETDEHVPNTYEVDDGFIVGDDEEDEEDQRRSDHRDSHKRRRSESRHEDSDDDDDDDVSSKKKRKKHRLKRLKKKNKLEKELEDLHRTSDDEQAVPLSDDEVHVSNADELRNTLFSAEDEGEMAYDEEDHNSHRYAKQNRGFREDDDDEMRGFIVGRSKRTEEYDDGDPFGYGQDYYEEEAATTVDARETLQKIFGPDEIAEQFMTEEDEIIRNEDIPERYQLSKTVRTVTEVEIADEANWIYAQVFEFMESGALFDSGFTNENNYQSGWGQDMSSSEQGNWGRDAPTDTGNWGRDVPSDTGNWGRDAPSDQGSWGQEMSSNQGSWGQELPQYDGMDDVDMNGSTSNLLKEKIIAEITQVLHFILINRYDIPYIAQYKKEYVATNLKYDDLWTIYEYDEKWSSLQSKKQLIRDLYRESQMSGIDFYQTLVNQSTNIEDVEDLISHFQLNAGPSSNTKDSTERKKRRSSRRDPYTVAKQSKASGITQHFGLTPMQYSENISLNFQMHKKNDHPTTAEVLVQEYVSSLHPTGEAVLKIARHILAREIAAEPYVRYVVRQAYKIYAQMSLTLTPKGEASSIIRLRDYKNVHKTSFSSYSRSSDLIQLMHIFRDERDGLVQITIDIPDERLNEVLKHEDLYFSRDASSSQSWNDQRLLIIQEVKKMLAPSMENFLRSHYAKKGKTVIGRACKQSLEQILHQGPFGNDKNHNPNLLQVYELEEEEENPRPTRHRIMSCCVGIDREITTFSVLDVDGQFKATLQWKFNVMGRNSNETKEIAEKQEDELRDFIRAHEPHALAVATSGSNSIKLFKIVQDIVNDLIRTRRIKCKGVFYAPDKFARIYEVSPIAQREFPGVSEIEKRAVFVARYFNDPLTALATLFNSNNDITCYKYHELQDMLSTDYLVSVIEQAFVTMVNAVGVDINRIVEVKNLQSVLRFVSGLGPRKADKIIKSLQARKSALLTKRKQLLESVEKGGIDVGKVVFLSCAAFIRILPPPGVSNAEFDVLDNTRIHPENYKVAIKIAMDALDMEDDTDENSIELVMKNPKRLEDLDLVSYAEELEKRGYGKRHSTLQDIKTELQDPFKDPRDDFIDLSSDDQRAVDLLFTYITGETDKTLHVGQLVSAMVQREAFGKNDQWTGFNCQLENGLRAFLHVDTMDTSKEIKPGSVIECIIIDIDKKGFFVKLSYNESEIQQAKEALVVNPTLSKSSSRSSSSSSSRATPKMKSRRQFKRNIHHPNFRNYNYGQAIEFLSDKPAGETLVRPSSLGPDHLAVTFKYLNDQFINLDVKEEDKVDINSLGRRLKIKDKTYADIDEICVSYVQSFIDYAKMLQNHHKYTSLDYESIEKELAQEKQKNPKSIPYKIAVNPKSPGRYIIYYMPNKRVKKQHISVGPEGYSFNQRAFTNITKLLNAFKTAFSQSQGLRPSSSSSHSHSSGTSSGWGNK